LGRLSLLFLLFAVPVLPQAPEAWVTTDFTFLTLGKFDFSGNAQIRTDRGMGGFAYARGGPVVTVRPKAWLTGAFGYWWQESETDIVGWAPTQRIYGGVEVRWWQHKGWQILSRQVGERFFLGDGLGANRYRQRATVQFPLRWRPTGQVECVFDERGLQFTRTMGTVRFSLSEHTDLTTGYFYDFFRLGFRNRQVISATLRFNKPWRR